MLRRVICNSATPWYRARGNYLSAKPSRLDCLVTLYGFNRVPAPDDGAPSIPSATPILHVFIGKGLRALSPALVYGGLR